MASGIQTPSSQDAPQAVDRLPDCRCSSWGGLQSPTPRSRPVSIEKEVMYLTAQVADIKDNHLRAIYKELWQMKGGVAVLTLLSLGTFIRSFF